MVASAGPEEGHSLIAALGSRMADLLLPEPLAAFFQVNDHFVTHLLKHVNVRLDMSRCYARRNELSVVNILRPDTEDNPLAHV